MNGSQFWELYQSYGDVYRQEVLNESIDNEGRYTRNPNSTRTTTSRAELPPEMRTRPGVPAMTYAERQKKEAAKSPEQIEAERQKRIRLSGKLLSGPNEQYDLYDVVLEHLLDEGYAETPEDATVLMANMSEQWFEAIVEASDDYDSMSPEELHREVTALDRRRRSGAPFSQDDQIRLAKASRRLKLARTGNTVVRKLKEDASTIQRYEDLANEASREGDKQRAEKYRRMIQKIQHTMSQRG